jgi:NitT/TauT family transport system ATP-binding protein
MIDIEGLSVLYGKEKALDKINLSIEKNSTCAVIGPSGCGKTTLLYVLAGLVAPGSGKVVIDGIEQNGIRQGTGIVFQDYGLLPWKTVWNNVALGLQVRKDSPGFIKSRTRHILSLLGLENMGNKYPSQLSGGQKQRVAIGRALAMQPDLLLMDEPSSALDAITKEHIQDLVLEIYKSTPMTMVLVTHNIEEAVFLGKKIVVMGKARIKHVLDNPYFGDLSLRRKEEFYRACIEVRKWLDGGEEK